MAYSIYSITIFKKKKMKKDSNKKNNLQKKWKEEKASYGCSEAHTRKDRGRFFFGFCEFMNFFLRFLVLFLAVRCLKITDFVSFPTFSNQYITYPVLTSTNFYPLFKRRDTAIFNFSTYHVFILGYNITQITQRIVRMVPYMKNTLI